MSPAAAAALHVFDTPVGRVGSLACLEHGMPLARFALHAKREQIQAELDLARIAREQQALDVAGHHDRPDVFRLEVEERPRAPLERQA